MIYVGCHTTKKLDDGYMGSGRYICEAIKKDGLENFEKEILFVFDTKKEMLDKEEEIVDNIFRNREDTYNVALGGLGYGMQGVKLSKETCEKMSNSRRGKKRIFSEKHRQSLRIACKKRKPQTPEMIEKRIAPLRGRKKPPLTEEIKNKIRLTKKLNPPIFTDEHRARIAERFRNTIWISNEKLQKTKMVKPEHLDAFLKDGWIRGRIRY